MKNVDHELGIPNFSQNFLQKYKFLQDIKETFVSNLEVMQKIEKIELQIKECLGRFFDLKYKMSTIATRKMDLTASTEATVSEFKHINEILTKEMSVMEKQLNDRYICGDDRQQKNDEQNLEIARIKYRSLSRDWQQIISENQQEEEQIMEEYHMVCRRLDDTFSHLDIERRAALLDVEEASAELTKFLLSPKR